jgi:hypothetical protein
MTPKQKILAYKAIDENVEHTTARQIIRYVLECELWGQDTVSPDNKHLSKKYGWSLDTVKVAISKAKKSQFITTTGYGKGRCLELNVSFLKGKMAEIYQKTLFPKHDFSDILLIHKPVANTLANTLANTSANTLANTLANSFSSKNGLTEPQNQKKGGDNNNNNNNNNNNIYIPEHSSDGISLSETKNSVSEKEPNEVYALMLWAEERRDAVFLNRGKQLKAISMLKKANIPPGKIKDRWRELEDDKFWKAKGFDFMDIFNSLNRKP